VPGPATTRARAFDYGQARCVQTVGPPPVLQHVLQSTCQHLVPAADTGVANKAAMPVPMTAAKARAANHFMFFLIGYLLGGPYHESR